MHDDDRQFLIATIASTWHSRPPEARPSTLWIAEHEQLAPDADSLRTDVVNAWVHTDAGLREVGPCAYVRFLTVHSARLWHSGIFGPSPGSGMPQGIGTSGFAVYEDDVSSFYVEWQFAGRDGRGFRYKKDAEGEWHVTELWVS